MKPVKPVKPGFLVNRGVLKKGAVPSAPLLEWMFPLPPSLNGFWLGKKLFSFKVESTNTVWFQYFLLSKLLLFKKQEKKIRISEKEALFHREWQRVKVASYHKGPGMGLI